MFDIRGSVGPVDAESDLPTFDFERRPGLFVCAIKALIQKAERSDSSTLNPACGVEAGGEVPNL